LRGLFGAGMRRGKREKKREWREGAEERENTPNKFLVTALIGTDC